MPPTIHASCAAWGESAVLLTGPSGAGKSDLLLRLIDAGFDLVADDRVILSADGLASAPSALAGLIEVRGVGLMRLPCRAAPVAVRLHVALASGAREPRLPEPRLYEPARCRSITLDPARASAVAIIRAALRFVIC